MENVGIFRNQKENVLKADFPVVFLQKGAQLFQFRFEITWSFE